MKINVDHYFIYSTDVLALCTQFGGVQHHIYVSSRQYAVTCLVFISAFVFISGIYLFNRTLQDPAEEICHMLAVSWTTLRLLAG